MFLYGSSYALCFRYQGKAILALKGTKIPNVDRPRRGSGVKIPFPLLLSRLFFRGSRLYHHQHILEFGILIVYNFSFYIKVN